MLISEVLVKEEQDDLLNAVEELIVRAKARDFTKIKTPTILAKLRSSGYTVDEQSLIAMLTNIKSVANANRKFITLDTAVPISHSGEDGDKVVSDLAAKQLKKREK